METLQATIDTFSGYVQKGGFVMPALVLATMALWYAMVLRYVNLRRGAVRSVRILLRRQEEGKLRGGTGIIDSAIVYGAAIAKRHPVSLRDALDDAFGDFDVQLRGGRVLIASISAVAPLAGLLGTVTGMIETFDSLAEMALFTQTGGIAGGISQALFTTQMGLVVAVPGVVIGRLLDQRQARLEMELDKVKDLLCARAAEVDTDGQEALA